MILYLHGAGERGEDLERITVHGIPRLLREGRRFPFVVVAPQWSDPESWWDVVFLGALLDEAGERYRIDPDRIYVTGLSMGGFGTWDLLVKFPDRFAAAVPVCGGGNPLLASRIRHIPVWVFHGALDDTVPVRRSREMVEALRAADAVEVRYTEYPDVGHDAWTPAYSNPEVYQWMLRHRRNRTPQGKGT